MHPNNSAECLFQLLKQLQIPATRRGVYDELLKHPHYPSLLACSDVLNAWGVPNGAFRIDTKELGTVPTPFMAQMTTEGGEFRLIKYVEIDCITSTPQAQHQTKFDPGEFEEHFAGYVLVAERNPEAGETHYSHNRRKERVKALRMPLVITGCLLLFGLTLGQSAWLESAKWQTIVQLIAKSTGLIISILLLSQSLGLNNPVLQRICGSGSNNSCNALLASPAAKLIEEISLAEVGFAYFAGTLVALIVMGNFPSIQRVLALISLLSLPFTLYSLYYQSRVARKWCVLCCAVQAILWAEFSVSVGYIYPTLGWPSFAEWIQLLGCFVAPVLGWVFVKPYIIREQEATWLEKQLLALKRDQLLFESAMATQPKYPLLSKSDAIRLGSPTAQHIITVVSNPTCVPCAQVHELLEQWLTWRDDVQVQIVFLAPDNPKDIRQQVASHLLVLNQQQPDMARAALRNWYKERIAEYGPWASRYPINLTAFTSTSLHKHHSWCQQAAVTLTPTIFLNGHPLPEYYELKDIQYLL